MKSLNIDDGSITLCINGDESRVISFNPTDVNFASRFYELIEDFNSKEQELLKKAKELDDGLANSTKNTADIFSFTKELDDYFKGKLDYVFGLGTSKACFGSINVMSIDKKGNRILNNFLLAITPFITKARGKELSKYTGKYVSNASEK